MVKKSSIKKPAAKKAATKRSVSKKSVAKKQKDDELPIQLSHTGKCPTLSGRSTLTFHIGLMDGVTYIRVFSNSGGGQHSKIWVPVRDFINALEKQPKDKPVTSYAFHSLFANKSANDAPFYFSVCLHLKLVSPSKEKKRQYRYDSPDAFLAQIDKLKSN